MLDKRAQYNEKAVGANHPSLADTLNRLALVEHNIDGSHKSGIDVDTLGGFETAVVAVGTTPTTLVISTPQTVTGNLTVPNTIDLVVTRTGLITVTPGRTLTYNGSYVRPEWFGAIADGSTDCTSAIQAAYNALQSGTVYFGNGTYKITGTITFGAYHKTVGAGRSNTIITTTSSTLYTFQFLSAIAGANYDIASSILFSDVTINAKYAVQINQSGDYTTIFSKQGAVLAAQFKNCTFNGVYSTITDANRDTATYPSESELKGYGVGLYCAKMFDARISECLFYNNGIGVYFDGCDINNIDTNRFFTNARHIHMLTNTNSYGYQNKIQNNDMLENKRRGAIYDETSMASIKDNYFETYTLAGEYYTNRNVIDTLLWGNRFDSNRTTTPIISVAPKYGMVVSNNRLNPNTPDSTIEVLSTYYSQPSGIINNFFVKFEGNSGSWPTTKNAYCEYDFNNPRYWDAYNPKLMRGVGSSTFPFQTSPVTGKQVIRIPSGSTYIDFPTSATESSFYIKFTGTKLTAGGAFNFRWGTTIVASTTVGFTETTKAETIKLGPWTKPAGELADAGVSIEFSPLEAEYQAIELVPS